MPARLFLRPQPRAFFLLTDTHALVFRQPGADESKAARSVVVAEFLPLDEVDTSGLVAVGHRAIEGVLGVTSVPSDRSSVPEVFLLLLNTATPLPPLIPGASLRPSRVVGVEFHSLTSNFWDPPSLTTDTTFGGFESDEDDPYYARAHSGAATLSQAQQQGVEDPCAGMRKYLEAGGFYFAERALWDISQHLGGGDNWVGAEAGKGNSALEGFDERFVWNAHLLKPLLAFRAGLGEDARKELDEASLLLPVVQGFVGSVPLAAGGGPGALALISRLSCKRAGARFRTRGIDDDGNVANFVETEVILTTGSTCVSYVQVRGSVPLFWQQPSQGLQTLQQRVEITRPAQATQPAFDKHFLDLLEHYDAVHIVNLLGLKDAEAMLSTAYQDRFNSLKKSLKDAAGTGDEPPPESMTYTPYDFHSAVRVRGHDGVRADMSSSREVDDSMDTFGYTAVDTESGEVIQRQHGVFRTNCLDCLDRTNFVQEVLSTIVLRRFLQSHGSNLLNSPTLWSAHRELWADNGDSLSKTYAGTGALNTSATRSGRKTFAGLLSDATKSVSRAYINNFQDKYKQTAIDMLLGLMAGQRPVILFDPVSDSVHSALAARMSEYSTPRDVRLFFGTWNVNGKLPNEALEPWLFPTSDRADIYAIAFQEIVELTPQQIVQPDPGKKRVWEKTIMESFGKQKGEYIMLRSEQLVGTAIIVVVKSALLPAIRNVEYASKKTGLQGLSGNKGGIGVRFDLWAASVCLMTCHLAAGQANYDDRNADYRTISHGLAFLRGKTIDAHDIVLWGADFNYRIDLGNEQVREAAANDDFDTLVAADQLGLARDEGQVFHGYSEGELTFRPTYKYDNGTDTYDTSEKQRIPAWTDRVLYKGNNLRQTSYSCADLRTSDHRPVYALFEATVPEVNEEVRARIKGELSRKARSTGGIKMDEKVEHAAQYGVKGLVKEFTSVSVDSSPRASPKPRPPPVTRDNKPVRDKVPSAASSAYAKLGQPPPLPPRSGSSTSVTSASHAGSAGSTAVPYEPRRRAAPPPPEFAKIGLPASAELTPVATGDFVLVPSPARPTPPLPPRHATPPLPKPVAAIASASGASAALLGNVPSAPVPSAATAPGPSASAGASSAPPKPPLPARKPSRQGTLDLDAAPPAGLPSPVIPDNKSPSKHAKIPPAPPSKPAALSPSHKPRQMSADVADQKRDGVTGDRNAGRSDSPTKADKKPPPVAPKPAALAAPHKANGGVGGAEGEGQTEGVAEAARKAPPVAPKPQALKRGSL